jgi:hypothetical protein
MSDGDPTLATQIITTGTATVSVIGSDGAGKSKILSAAEVRTAGEAAASSHTHAQSDVTNLVTDLAAKASITNRREYFPTIAHAADTDHDLTIGAARIWVSNGTDERLIDFDSETIAIDGAGLDTGTVANSTWYYLWAFYNPTTDDSLYLLSASTTAPTAPSGYTFKRFLCEQIAAAVLTNGSANLYQAVFDGRILKWQNSQLLVDFDSFSPATTRTAVTVSAPAFTCRYLCRLTINNSSSGVVMVLYDRGAEESDVLATSVADIIMYAAGSVRAVSQQIDYIATSDSGYANLSIRAIGYEV